MSAPMPPTADRRYELVTESATEVAPDPPLRIIARVLRGRRLATLAVCAALAALGGALGYRLVTPTYRSTGLILIEGALTPIMYNSQETQIPPMFEAYMSAQINFLNSRQVLESAVKRPEMRRIDWPEGPEGVAALQTALRVERVQREHIITASVTHRDPLAAQTAIDAILIAFRELAVGPPGLSVSAKERALVQREASLEAQLQSIRKDLLELSDQYGQEGINRMHTNTIEQLIAVDQKIAELQLSRERGIEPGSTPGTRSIAGNASTRGQEQLTDRLFALVAERESLLPRFSERHPVIRDFDRRIEMLQIQMELQGHATAPERGAGPLVVAPAADDTDGWRERLDFFEQRYLRMRDDLRAQAAKLGGQRVALAGLNERAVAISNQLNATRRRIDEIRVESRQQNLNRVSIAAFGDAPVTPASDRRQGLAAACTILGAGTGFACMVLIGLLDTRIRFVDELTRHDELPPVIGMLPVVDERRAERVTRASQSIHQIRNLLDLQCADATCPVIALTSPDRGEGKTTVALSLGSSFAAANRRTLVIDADTTRFGLSRQLGLEGRPGLGEAIGPTPGSGQVHATQRENLFAMPIGAANGIEAETLSSSKLLWLLDHMRKRYDVIVIDTGPILSSVEASLMAALADRVVLVTRRIQRLGRVQAAVSRLRPVGAACCGIVFNRATRSDFEIRDTHPLDHFPRLVAGSTGPPIAPEADLDRGTRAA
ncbi:MAG: hypothetical protein HKO59_15615 [Phycisphaerales bacterium]|nr:hypothetical protein [Phycisphaerae bacterium]NNF42459.1 hypothetical protein [Phycisphaerales bacterium]NNM27383.1 hypothetical protein [Phycisphaerales bacterium]